MKRQRPSNCIVLFSGYWAIKFQNIAVSTITTVLFKIDAIMHLITERYLRVLLAAFFEGRE